MTEYTKDEIWEYSKESESFLKKFEEGKLKLSARNLPKIERALSTAFDPMRMRREGLSPFAKDLLEAMKQFSEDYKKGDIMTTFRIRAYQEILKEHSKEVGK